MGVVHTGSKAAVQRTHTTASAALIDSLNGGASAPAVGAAVSTADMSLLNNNKSAKDSAVTAAKNASIHGNTALLSALGVTASSGGASAAVDAVNTAAAVAAQKALAIQVNDATKLAAIASAEAAANTAAASAIADAAAAAAAVAAATGSAAVDAKTVFDNRLQINVDASAETSSGLTFGVRSRIRINENETGALSAPRVYVKSGAVEVAVGNIYGALDSMPGMYDSEVGLTALSDAGVVLNTVGKGDWAFDGYSSQGKGVNGIEAIYSAGGFTGHLSYSEPDLSGSAAVTNKHVAAVGAYTMGDWTVALGMQDSDNNAEDKTVLTVGGKVGDYGVGFAAADNDGVTKIALNGSATFGATTVNGFVADDESGTDTAYGLGVSYDLGGAALVGGVERDAVGVTRADMGVSFSF